VDYIFIIITTRKPDPHSQKFDDHNCMQLQEEKLDEVPTWAMILILLLIYIIANLYYKIGCSMALLLK